MSYENTGKKSPGNTITVNAPANGELISPSAADKSYVIYDIFSYGSGKLGTAADGEGTKLGFINAGHNNVFLVVPAGQGVYTNAQSGSITITYAIVDGLPASLITNIASGGGTTTTTAAPTNLEFALATSSIAEGDSGTSTHTVTVDRIGNTNGTATVDYATANLTASSGVDYTATSGTLTFTAGVTSQTISITIAGDTGNEDDETFNITLSSPTQTVGAASITGTNPHVVTITNDDTSTIGFASATSSVAEGDSGTSTHTIAVTRSDTNGTASVDYATADGTATSGTDYTGISTTTLSFADGVGSMNISVVISGDTTVESNETFTVSLTNPTSQYGAAALGTSTHTVTITNDDTTTTTTTTAAPASNACVAQTSGNEYYWNVDSTFTPVVGANATHYSRTQYVNTDGSLWLAYNGTESKWKINDGVNLGGSDWYESDNDGTNPWDAAWTNGYIGVTEKANATHCYPAGTSNFCIAGQGYYPEYEGTWVPYNTYNGKAVWWNPDGYANTGTNMLMWYDSGNSVWQIYSDGWEPHSDNGYASSYSQSDGDGTNPWDADWSTDIGLQTFDSINSGDC